MSNSSKIFGSPWMNGISDSERSFWEQCVLTGIARSAEGTIDPFESQAIAATADNFTAEWRKRFDPQSVPVTSKANAIHACLMCGWESAPMERPISGKCPICKNDPDWTPKEAP